MFCPEKFLLSLLFLKIDFTASDSFIVCVCQFFVQPCFLVTNNLIKVHDDSLCTMLYLTLFCMLLEYCEIVMVKLTK